MKAGYDDRRTVPDLLIKVVEVYPHKGIGFVQADGRIKFMTYQELLSRASALLGNLQASGLAPGDKVMIVMIRNVEIVSVLWACFLGGFIPTILQPPLSFTEFNQPAQKIDNVFRTLQNPKIILSADLYGSFQSDVIPAASLINAEELKNQTEEFVWTKPKESDIAFIQFSSGSTGDPKGIILTHKNILTNIAAIGAGLDFHNTDVFTNWMPLYHDMGLFGYHICPIFSLSNQYLIDPVDFVKKPSLWLDVMDEVRCTITGCPNFGQALLLRYLKNREVNPWDLSSIKGIVNGAEPISPRIMNGFLDSLSGYGLRKESMMPAYGMAEATLAITFSELLKAPVITTFNRTLLQKEGKAVLEKEDTHDMIELVSVGKPLNDIEMRIVSERGHPLGEGFEGHIQIRGSGITSGYYNNPAETRNSFSNTFLKTGDKGFIFDDNLYITGRIKDIIFVRGKNLYAHDLENLAIKHSDIPYGKVIIAGLFDPKKGQDQILLFLVGSPNKSTCNTFLSLHQFFRDTYGVTINIFIPIRSNQVPKTSSGKIQRHKLVASYQNGEFDGAIAEMAKLMKG
ncbi:MAG: AMP-binding protein [Bacteroidales bacterium]|nr:AMP-binding protein [Lentimicrobiaceae bacterium]MDD5694676.1 AMP-binding protein [Bacteroidales bacterium]